MITRKTCVITGASSGLGAALAREVAATWDCTDLVLTARREDRLNALAVELKTIRADLEVKVITADLGFREGRKILFDGLGPLASSVDMWINNAGFGLRGSFLEQDPEDLDRMLEVDVRALMQCTAFILPKMMENRHGHILNISSVAAFSPMPWFAVYAACKAFVLSFSEAISREIAGSGVSVTAFCPGPMPTEFFDIAGKTRWHGPSFLWISAEKAAKDAISATLAGQAVHIPQKTFVLQTFLSRFFPRSLVTLVAGRVFRE